MFGRQCQEFENEHAQHKSQLNAVRREMKQARMNCEGLQSDDRTTSTTLKKSGADYKELKNLLTQLNTKIERQLLPSKHSSCVIP